MNKPEMKPVESSMVNAIGYDFDSSTLWVEYKGGKFYTYVNVEPNHWDMMNTEGVSVGTYINKIIKPNYAATKVEA